MKNGLRWGFVALGLTASVAHASTPDRTSTRTYNAQGLVGSIDGPRTDVSDITQYTYDTQGHLATVTDALGHVTTYDTYDSQGNPGRTIDANQVISLMTYTPQGWPATVTRDSTGTPSTTTLTYDEVGDVTQSQDADGVVVTYTYDGARRLTDITDASGNHIHYTLDAAGNQTKKEIFDAANTLRYTVSKTYNSLSQLLTVTDALNRIVLTYNYPDGHDALGQPAHSADAAGIQRKQGYDALNRLVSTIDNANGTDTATQNTQSQSTYDSSDNLTGVTDPNNLQTTYTYDGFGNRTALQSPDTGSSSYTYDAAGNQLTHTDAKGVVSTASYDALNRLTSTSYVDPTLSIVYHYDEPNSTTGCPSSSPIGHLTRIVENAVSTMYCYDARGNVIRKQQVTATTTDTTLYAYTLANRLSMTSEPDGTLVSNSYNSNGQISGVQVTPVGSVASTVASAITYLAFGPLSSYTLGNGQVVTRTYDANYALTDIASPALNLHFARDAMGNITAEGNSTGADPAAENYSYDPLYRLTGITDGATSLAGLTYNKTGDRLTETGSGLGVGAYDYTTGTHQLSSIGNAARTYDANGNTTGSTSAGQTWGFGYNGRNRMTVVQASGSTVGTYTYNALGQRIQKIATAPIAISQRYVYDEQNRLIGEYTSTGKRDTIWLGGIPIAIVDTAGLSSTVNYVIADHLGAPRAVSDSSGTIIWSWPYVGNPFGEQQPTSTTGYVLNLRYPGQYYDAESGTNYNLLRTYESATGRYLQSDPIGLNGGSSTYAYVGNNPLMSGDPMGLETPKAASGCGTMAWAACGSLPTSMPSCTNPCGCEPNFGLLATIIGTEIVGLGPEDPLADAAVVEEIAAAEGTEAADVAVSESEYDLTKTVESHAESRPFVDSPLTVQEIETTGPGIPDPGGIPNAVRYDVPGSYNGSKGIYELVIDRNTKMIYHFLFKGGK
jgi:RHS repeat-associated protein